MPPSFDNNRIDQMIAEGHAEQHLEARSRYGKDQSVEQPLFHRMVVMEVISDPTKIDQTTAEYYEHELKVVNAKFARVLPRNSIIAQRITDGTQSASDRPMFLFPFFPSHLSFPCKAGEHVWGLFESSQKNKDLGYWLCRIPTPGYVDDVNHTHAPREFDSSFLPSTGNRHSGNTSPKYEFRNGVPEDSESTRGTRAESSFISGDEKIYEHLIKETNSAKLTTYESVPRYRKRPADLALEGSNNTLIVLGTDRVGSIGGFKDDDEKGVIAEKLDSDATGAAGVIDLVAGRGQSSKTSGASVENSVSNRELRKASTELVDGEGDPDFITDRTRLYLAQRTKTDKNFKLDKFNKDEFSVEDSDKGDGSAIIKSDKVRIIGRKDVEFIVLGFEDDDNGLPKDGTDSSKYVVIIADGKSRTVHIKCEKTITLQSDTVDLKADKVLVGDGADAHLVRYEDLKREFDNHIHPSGVGPTEKPTIALSDKVKSANNKVK